MNYEEMTRTDVYVYAREPIEVPLLWLIQNTFASCDMFPLDTFEGWQEMFNDKCSDTGFGHLVNSIMERGFLRDGAIGWDEGEITEGHHRLCAAILLGLDTVWISRYGKNVPAPKSVGGYYPNLVCAHYAVEGLAPMPVLVDF